MADTASTTRQPPEQLLALWRQGKLSTEEALSRLMASHHRQQQTIDALNITVYNLRSDLDDLIAQTGIKPRRWS